MARGSRADAGHDHDEPHEAVAASPGRPAPGGELAALQRRLGNRALRGLMAAGQARLEVGSVDDPLEQEADAVARQVVSALRQPRQAASPVQTADLHRTIRRRAIGAEGGAVDAATESAIASARGGGVPLEGGLRGSLEEAFGGGTDFSGVRLHSGAGAAQLNRAVSAEAFTVGSDIFFSGALPDAKSRAGQELLAHELTHTVQQGASCAVHRFWNPFKKKEVPPAALAPDEVLPVMSAMEASPEMRQVKSLRSQGLDGEALAELERYFDSGSITLKGRVVKLAEFKPLLFTPAERQLKQNKSWAQAGRIRQAFNASVRSGDTRPPASPPAPAAAPASAASPAPSTAPSAPAPVAAPPVLVVPPVTAAATAAPAATSPVVDMKKYAAPTSEGGIGTAFEGVAGVAETAGHPTQVAQHFEDPHAKASLTSTTYNHDGDPGYEDPAMKSSADWAKGVLEVVADAFTFLSQALEVFKKIGDEESSKSEVAQSASTSLASLSTTAGAILETIEKSRGSELTTKAFHWVPGLRVFSNAFAALTTTISIVRRAGGLHALRTTKEKVTAADKAHLKDAMIRLHQRSAQQMSTDVINLSASLTNTALALTEVGTAGGFGVPALASLVVSGSTTVLSLGNAIHDSFDASATKRARVAYLGAHEAGSAEKLIKTDPRAAAETIVSQAMDGDAEAIAVMKGFGVDVKAVAAHERPGVTSSYAPNVPALPAGLAGADALPGRAATSSEDFHYDPETVEQWEGAVEKLSKALAVDADPKTIGDKLKGMWTSFTGLPTSVRDRFRDAKRIAASRNEAQYKGKADRGTGWAVKTALFGGDDKVTGMTEKTKLHIAGSTMSAAKKAELSAQLLPERARRIDEEMRARSAALKAAHHDIVEVDPAAMRTALALPQAQLSSIIQDGQKASTLTPKQWNSYVQVYLQSTQLRAGRPLAAAPAAG